MREKKFHRYLLLILVASIVVSCRLRPLTYSSQSESFLKKDQDGSYSPQPVSIESYNYHLQIDSMYGTKKAAWIEGKIFFLDAAAPGICIYSVEKVNTKYQSNSLLACSDQVGLVKFKVKRTANTILFMVANKQQDSLPYKVYELLDVSLINE